MAAWYSVSNLVGAQEWQDEIGLALRRCDRFLVLASRNASGSMWVRRETAFLLNQRRLLGRISVVVLDDSDPADVVWALDTVQHARLRGDFDATCAELLRTWGLGLESSRIHRPFDRFRCGP